MRIKVEPGQTFTVRPGIQVKVIKRKSPSMALVEDEQGNSRWVKVHSLVSGLIRWRNKDGSLSKLMPGRRVAKALTLDLEPVNDKYAVGSVLPSNKHGNFEIVEVASCTNITVRWLDTGSIEGGYTSYQLKKGSLIDASRLIKEPKGFYVYLVTGTDGSTLYVGKGKKLRYCHPQSGKSSNRELNRLYFAGKILCTEVYQMNLNEADALKLERELIKAIQPMCNVMHKHA